MAQETILCGIEETLAATLACINTNTSNGQEDVQHLKDAESTSNAALDMTNKAWASTKQALDDAMERGDWDTVTVLAPTMKLAEQAVNLAKTKALFDSGARAQYEAKMEEVQIMRENKRKAVNSGYEACKKQYVEANASFMLFRAISRYASAAAARTKSGPSPSSLAPQPGACFQTRKSGPCS